VTGLRDADAVDRVARAGQCDPHHEPEEGAGEDELDE
jgi:hypothetical protein